MYSIPYVSPAVILTPIAKGTRSVAAADPEKLEKAPTVIWENFHAFIQMRNQYSVLLPF